MAEENQNEGQEKSFEASEHKIRQAREKGNVPQSKETTNALVYIGLTLAIVATGGFATTGIMESLGAMLAKPEEFANSFLYDKNQAAFSSTALGVFGAMLPIFLIPAVFVIVSLIGQQAIVFAPTKIKPKMSKISIISNAKQKFGPAGMGEFAKSFVKMMAVGVIASIFVFQQYFDLPQMVKLPDAALPSVLQEQTVGLLIMVIIVSIAIAAVDLPWVRHSHAKKLRMTLQEVRDEAKQNEGDPHQKQARRRRAEAIAMNTMLRDVETADVVIVNPEHYAVALKWERAGGNLPVCVAKGVDEVAFRIRERAKISNIPVRSDPPCARSLYATVEIGDPIKPEHYAAVAAAIHFADQLKTGGWRNA